MIVWLQLSAVGLHLHQLPVFCIRTVLARINLVFCVFWYESILWFIYNCIAVCKPLSHRKPPSDVKRHHWSGQHFVIVISYLRFHYLTVLHDFKFYDLEFGYAESHLSSSRGYSENARLIWREKWTWSFTHLVQIFSTSFWEYRSYKPK